MNFISIWCNVEEIVHWLLLGGLAINRHIGRLIGLLVTHRVAINRLIFFNTDFVSRSYDLKGLYK
jgi:hypothetical protein